MGKTLLLSTIIDFFPLIVPHLVTLPTGDRLLRAGNCGAKILRQTQAGEEDNAGNNNASETLL